MELPRGTERLRKETAPDARVMTRDELSKRDYRDAFELWKRGEGDCPILLGKDKNRDQQERWIGVADDRHLITVAGSRAGKSSTCLKPNLFLWPSSVLCIDPKGELAEETAVARAKMGQDVYILDPFGEVKGEAAQFRKGYNLLNELQAASPDDVIDDAAMLADALIVPDKGGDSHWTNAAKNFLRGLILCELNAAEHESAAPSLAQVRKLLTLPLSTKDGSLSLLSIFTAMRENQDAYDGVMAGIGGTMESKPDTERGSIISTAVEQTAFMDSGPMQRHLSADGLDTLRSLKRRPTTIYLVLPASRMATHFRWFRMILTLALAALEREPMQLKAPVLFVLEEFPQLGYMRQIEAAAGLMAGYGVKLWSVLQDLSQLKSQYRDSWETFLGNAGLVQVFGNTDATTTEYISRALGERTIKEMQRQNITASAAGSGAIPTETPRSVPLLAPFEIAQFAARDTGMQLCLFAGKPPAYLSRLSHKEVNRFSQ